MDLHDSAYVIHFPPNAWKSEGFFLLSNISIWLYGIYFPSHLCFSLSRPQTIRALRHFLVNYPRNCLHSRLAAFSANTDPSMPFSPTSLPRSRGRGCFIHSSSLPSMRVCISPEIVDLAFLFPRNQIWSRQFLLVVVLVCCMMAILVIKATSRNI